MIGSLIENVLRQAAEDVLLLIVFPIHYTIAITSETGAVRS